MDQRVDIVEADLGRADHQDAIVSLIAGFAADPMGGGVLLSEETRNRLVPGLRSLPTTLIYLAYVEGEAVGIAVCFRGFSTFFAKPLINIHDLAVSSEQRGLGIGRLLLDFVEARARTLGCCKVTLEVHVHNTTARQMYERAGFSGDSYGDSTLFYTKLL